MIQPDLEGMRKLYPGLTDEELQDAHYRLVKHLKIAIRVYEDLENDPEAMAAYKRK